MRTTEEILHIAAQLTEGWVWKSKTEKPEPNRLDVYVERIEDLVPMAVGLRVQGLGYLSAITGLDYGLEAGTLEVLYHFCTGEAVITLRVSLPRMDASVPTMTEIIPSAEAFERELSEMFGITVVGLRNPLRLYLPDDMPEHIHPLRKDIRAEEIVMEAEL
jgi:Ni,Fe-hydrogenase III component G